MSIFDKISLLSLWLVKIKGPLRLSISLILNKTLKIGSIILWTLYTPLKNHEYKLIAFNNKLWREFSRL
jgi:heme/copper-type cytochrome/quinol oxidase subunit 1